jgi:DNA invertase Pin-like site-specific DNA recombinase
VTGKVMVDTFGVFAEFEVNLRRERRLEGDHAAKAGGVYKGRKQSADAGKVFALVGDGSARWRSPTD